MIEDPIPVESRLSEHQNHSSVSYQSPLPRRTKQPPASASLADFDVLRLLGCGKFGSVLQVSKKTGKDAGTLYAMKVLKKSTRKNFKTQKDTAFDEARVMMVCDSPFICKLYYTFQSEHRLFLVTDYFAGGEFYLLVKREDGLGEARAAFYLAEIALGIGYLHSQGILYGDVKPDNVMLDVRGHAKLIDFGFVQIGMTKDSRTRHVAGTLIYLAPEVVLREPFGFPSDWWSYGCLAFAVITGTVMFQAETNRETVENIIKNPITISEYLSDNTMDFIRRLIRRSARKRLGNVEDVEDIKNHPYFAGIDWARIENQSLKPPFVPDLTSEINDVRFFDPAVTSTTDFMDLVVDNPTQGADDANETSIPGSDSNGCLPDPYANFDWTAPNLL